MSICFGTELFLGFLFVSFVNVYQFVCELLSILDLKVGCEKCFIRF